MHIKRQNKKLNITRKNGFQFYYKKERIPIYVTKTALKRMSDAIFNVKIVDLDESWLNR